jgi:uncharacterized protein YyaL (SSP411 family)
MTSGPMSTLATTWGGWPTTAFLTPEGEVLAGATYLPPEQMRQVLSQVADYYRTKRGEIAQKVADLRQRRAAATAERTPLAPSIFEVILRSVMQNYDPVFGGFGDAPKFPHSGAIDLLLYAYQLRREPDILHMARKTLEFMVQGGLFDKEWGGFFRYATRRDWKEPHYEKMLEDNANLLRNFLHLYRVTKDEAHAAVAQHIIEYLEARLRHPAGFFCGSQDADESFYRLSAAQRRSEPEPYIDRTCYITWNAMAAFAYLEASWVLGRPDLQEKALAVLAFAWDNCRQPDQGMYHFYDGQSQLQGLLGDQACMARALVDAYEVSADPLYLERAQEIAAFMLDRFAHEGGEGLLDIWDEGEPLGHLRDRQRPLQENTVCAEVFLRLYSLTRNERFKQVAQATLEAFAGSFQAFGPLAADYAKGVDMCLGSLTEVHVVGVSSAEATQSLHLAALSLDVPASVVQVLDPARDAQLLAALSLPPEPAPVAYACVGTLCSAPIVGPQVLAETVRQMREAPKADLP